MKNLQFSDDFFFQPQKQNWKDTHKISFSELAALFMKFPTHSISPQKEHIFKFNFYLSYNNDKIMFNVLIHIYHIFYYLYV